MPSFEDDDERDLPGSQEGSSDDDGDDTMRDVDDDNDESGDSDNEDNNGEPDSAAGQDSLQGGGPQQESARTAEQSAVRVEMLTADSYDIVPTIAAPQSTSVNAICATWDARWVFTGGSDGYIRKFNWVESVNNKLALTVAQRHPFVDSVVKAGVLISYWENWDVKARTVGAQDSTPVISPVYSLACHSQGLWLLSGTASGAIRLQSTRHDEGKQIALLRQHTSAVSVLTLSSDERNLLSGSWDKTVLDWDLATGQVKTTFASSAGQISSIESRPISSLPVPAESGEIAVTNGVSRGHGDDLPNGVLSRAQSQMPVDPSPSSRDSLFGGDEGDDDLFGESVGAALANGAGDVFGEDDDEMARAMADGPPVSNIDDAIMADTSDGLQPVQPPQPEQTQSTLGVDEILPNGGTSMSEQALANGLPHADDMEGISQGINGETDAPVTSDSTFLATSIDGAIRVWDRRQPKPVARIMPRNTPPWCMSACWSPDGNYIFAGRRNNTVEEYDLRKGLKEPERVFKFPNGSGAVTSFQITRGSQLTLHPLGSSKPIAILVGGRQLSVIEPSEKTFTEYGVQDLGSSAAKSKICSVKIESKTDKVFQILVKPRIPFPFDENESGIVNQARYQSTPAVAPPCSTPFYMDGNKRPDCTFSLPLNPADPFYKPKGIIFRGRLEANETTAESADTSPRLFKVRGWKWKNNGNIEDMLSDCSISAADTEADKTADEIAFEDLANNFSLAAGMGNTRGRYEKTGVIRVVIKRIHITSTADSTYTVDLSFMSWVPYKRREDLFAEFRFQYMPRHKLVKLGLCSEDGTPTFPMARCLARPEAEGVVGPEAEGAAGPLGGRSGNSNGKRAMGEMDSGSSNGSDGNLVTVGT
ncbi:hypothetical protein DV737_g3861, partial [Chaetothyriales sp. CBS 132003]